MSTAPSLPATHSIGRARQTPAGLWAMVQTALAPLASLRLTVVLFFFSMVLVLVGTLAQVDKDMWEVIRDYFRCWIAIIELQVFFPKVFFREALQIPGWFPFPGGLTIGAGLGINLLAAHLARFKVQAKGRQFWIGLAVVLFGVLLTTIIVLGGHDHDGLQGEPLVSWEALWNLIRFSLVGLWIGTIFALFRMSSRRRLEFAGMLLLSVFLGGTSLYLVAKGDSVRLGDSSLRILWQLIQGGVAGVVLLVGCMMLFKRRGGIVVIHIGVGLIMFNELLVGLSAVEEQITLAEGQSTSFARDIREVELAVIDRSPADHDEVTTIPESRLIEGKPISNAKLPFDLEVVEFLPNAVLDDLSRENVNLATTGLGTRLVARPARSAGGAEANQAVDVAAAYVKITLKDGSAGEQTYLFAQHFGDADVLLASAPAPISEKIVVGNKTYDVLLRYKRNYKSYRITLDDVQKNDYLGTSTPRDYSSWVHLEDPERNTDRQRIRIWMNNPLRYAGETFYQSNYAQRMDGMEVTTLQVVTNTGWMIPYIACMFVWVGMMFHFMQTLLKFLRKMLAEQVQRPVSRLAWGLPIVLTAIATIYVVGKAIPRDFEHEGMQLTEFGKLPIVEGGRVKPLDTLARNTLRTLSNKQELVVPKEEDDYARTTTQPAIRWLADVISRRPAADRHRVFRIDNLEVLDTLGLQRRDGFLYSVEEIRSNEDALRVFEQQALAASKLRSQDASKLTYYQQKLLETDLRLRAYTKLQNSFMPVPFPPLPTQKQMEEDPELATKVREEIASLVAAVPKLNQSLMAMQPAMVVPLSRSDDLWLPYAAAFNEAFVASIFSGERPDRRLNHWSNMIGAYARRDATDFNRALTSYKKDLQLEPPADLRPAKVEFESDFNAFQPFIVAMALYVLAFLLTAGSWAGLFEPLRRSAFWIVVLALIVHTFALIARIYISGRPPVTNLYSSAVFIGWGAVVFGVVIELLTRLGIGNLVGSIIGFSTLIIAHQLAYGGDTFTVLQAVLDTQFWLATHVVCISCGYVATFVAGGLAAIYIVAGVLTPAMRADNGKLVSRIVYGTLCFAIFFSFVGTVLGGLWADDSWGRFWGWDPKENGALMIVLWNALILHARWGGMVRDRGVAVLAVVGNIVTAWSWFGVNELGIGLHSYGFTEGVLANLGRFAAANLLVVGLGMLPLSLWYSRRVEAT